MFGDNFSFILAEGTRNDGKVYSKGKVVEGAGPKVLYAERKSIEPNPEVKNQNPEYEVLDDLLCKNGVPLTGKHKGVIYKQGVKFTGKYGNKYYEDGEEISGHYV